MNTITSGFSTERELIDAILYPVQFTPVQASAKAIAELVGLLAVRGNHETTRTFGNVGRAVALIILGTPPLLHKTPLAGRGDLVGIITEHQLLKLVYSPEIKGEKVCDLMTKDVLKVQEETDLSDVAHMMEQNRVRRIPVVRNGQVVGIISRRDLLRCVSENEEVLREFCALDKVTAGA